MMKQYYLMNFGHVNGNFNSESTLLNEGYTSLRINDENHYQNEQLLAAMMCETFGEETIREGYYGFDLNNALTNKIVEKTGRDNTEVYEEVSTFLEDIQSALYKTADIGEDFRKDPSLMEEYTALFSKFEAYYEQVNDKKMSSNVIMNAIQDYLQGTKSRISLGEEENIQSLQYKNDGSLVVQIGKHADEIEYTKGIQTVQLSERTHSRSYVVTQDEKYSNSKLFTIVEDKNIDYPDL